MEDITKSEFENSSKQQDNELLPHYDDLEEVKYTVLQTVDLSDLTFSSFSDIISGDCSYYENAYGTDPALVVKQSQNNYCSLGQNEFNINNPYNINFEQGVETLIRNDNCNFYQVFEVVENPVTEKNVQDQSVNCKSEQNFYQVFEVIENPVTEKDDKAQPVKCKSQKNSRRKRKKKSIKKSTGVIRKGQRYLPNFKQKVLDYASNHTFKETALHFNINSNTITEWVREKKRLSSQKKSTTSKLDSVSRCKTEKGRTPSLKTDNVIQDDSVTIETEINDKLLKKIEEDLPLGNFRSDERFVEWIQARRKEGKELSRTEVYHAGQYCLKNCVSHGEQPIWFILWLKRYERILKKLEKSDHETEKYIMYPNNFKLEVASYAKLFTKNWAARVFNVPRKRVFEWFKCSKCPDDNESVSTSEPPNGDVKEIKSKSKIYGELHDWYKKKHSEGFSPTSREIKDKASELFKENGIGNMKFSEGWLHKFCKRLNIKLRHSRDDHLLLWILSQFDNNVSLSHQEITEKSSNVVGKKKEFKGSKGWTLRFLKRHSNLLQQVPTVEDKLPDIFQSEITNFCSSFRCCLSSNKISAASIGCMDEIPISFNYPEDGNPSKLPLLRKTGFENCQAIVILCVLADGRALPPAVVLRGNNPRQLSSDGNVENLILYQEDGIVDLDVIEKWMEDIWLRFVSPPSILIADSFQPHCSNTLKERLAKDNCLISIIPEGCSSQLQPLDVEVTPKFKDLIKTQWKELPSNEVEYMSKMNKKCKCPDEDTILHWIMNAYRKIEENPHSIINSFKVVGLVE